MEGERLGPVTFSELRIKALEGKLNPRLDMAWTKGMPNWTATGEIEGLFDRRAASGSLAPTGTAEPYRPPEVDSTDELPSQPASWPGARRRSYLFMSLIFPALWMGAVSFATPFLARQFGQESLAMGIPFLMSLAAMLIDMDTPGGVAGFSGGVMHTSGVAQMTLPEPALQATSLPLA